MESFAGTLQELEARAANGALDGCFLKAVVRSDDPIPELADRVAEWSPACVIFNLVNEVANRPVKAISGTDDGEEPSIEDLFLEWRSTAATGRATKAPRDTVLALFREAVAGSGGEEGTDFGLTRLTARAEGVLAALRGGLGLPRDD